MMKICYITKSTWGISEPLLYRIQSKMFYKCYHWVINVRDEQTWQWHLSLISVTCSWSQLELDANMTWLNARFSMLYVTNMCSMNASTVPTSSRPLQQQRHRCTDAIHSSLSTRLNTASQYVIIQTNTNNSRLKAIYCTTTCLNQYCTSDNINHCQPGCHLWSFPITSTSLQGRLYRRPPPCYACLVSKFNNFHSIIHPFSLVLCLRP